MTEKEVKNLFISKFFCTQCNDVLGSHLTTDDSLYATVRKIKMDVGVFLCKTCHNEYEKIMLERNPKARVFRKNDDDTMDDVTGMR